MAAAVSLHGTILSATAGGNGSPYEYLVGDHRGDVTRLISPWPLAADPGDDVRVTGERIVEAAGPHPAIRIDRPPRLLPRLTAQMRDAELRGFGPKAAARPGLVAAMALGLRLVLGRARDGRHCVIRSVDRTGDAVLSWGADLIARAAPESPLFILDPLAFDHGWSPLMGTRAERIAAMMKNRLPAMLGDEAGRLSRDLGERAAGNTTLYHARGAVGPAVVQPYDPGETGIGKFQSYTRLPAAHWLPRRIVPADWRRRYTLAHELAHTAQHLYGFGREDQEGDSHRRHRMECFADGFAILTLAQAGAPREVLQDMIDHRRIGLAAAPTGYYTAPVGDAALAAVDAGRSIGADPRALLALAAELADRHALSALDFGRLDGERKLALLKAGIATRDSGLGAMTLRVADGEAARLAMAAAAAAGPILSAHWPAATAALDRLADAPASAEAAARASADLAETLAALPPGRLAFERLRQDWTRTMTAAGGDAVPSLLRGADRSLAPRAGAGAWPSPDAGIILVRPKRPRTP